MDINIRKAEKQDMHSVLELINELAVFEKEPEAVIIDENDLIRDGFGENPAFHCFVAEADGAISNKETEMLRNYATIFGLSPEKFERLTGKKKPTAIFDKGEVILDDPQFDYLDDLEIDDDFEFDEE